MYPKSLEQLIECFKMLPGVGTKTAERYAFQVLDLKEEEAQRFLKSIQDSKEQIQKCRICGNIAENDLCEICKNGKRDTSLICVVQSPKDVIAMEKTGEYNGVYHVLNGVISTSKGILPDDINIASLLPRINESVKEVILATNLTVEGETTSLYLARILQDKACSVTRIAHGLPMGGHLDYADELTLIKAFEGRKKID